MKLKFGKKSKKKILKSIVKIELVLVVFLIFLGFGKIQGTNSFFTDTEGVSDNEMTAGYWIPVLAMSVSGTANADGWYTQSPCVSLSASELTVGEAEIYFEFSNDGDPLGGGTAYGDSCVPIPDGNPTQFQAQAVNSENPDWKSNIVSGQFKVDTTCPIVQLSGPLEGVSLSGEVPIRGTVTDLNPHHYWLVIENSAGTKVAGPGTVNDTHSFTDENIFNWNTATTADGNYKIKLEARDAAGNKCPNQAPVPADPENPTDSVDWITVAVNNSGQDKIVLNEILPNPAGADNSDKDHSEFVELYNKGTTQMNLNGWRIYIGDSDFIEINDNNTDGNGTIIGGNDFLVIWLSKKWSESIMNNSSEKVSIYTGPKDTSEKIDEYEYGKGDLEDKTSARIPDGTGSWVDPVPTPGKKNKLEEPQEDEIAPAETKKPTVIENGEENSQSAVEAGDDAKLPGETKAEQEKEETAEKEEPVVEPVLEEKKEEVKDELKTEPEPEEEEPVKEEETVKKEEADVPKLTEPEEKPEKDGDDPAKKTNPEA